MAGLRQLAARRPARPGPDARRRLYVLLLFSWVNLLQCLHWFTFSSLEAEKFLEHFHRILPPGADLAAADFQVRLMLNWGPICGVLLFPCQGWLLTRPRGLARALDLALHLVLLGASLRLLPSLLALLHGESSARPLLGSRPLSLSLLHLAQILNACAGPFLMGSASRLSLLWFPEEQRTTATAVASTANGAGATLGFLLGPALAPTAAKYPRLLIVEVVFALVPWLAARVYLPAAPARPPSAAAAAEASPGFREGLSLVLKQRSYGLLVLSAGVLAGAGAAWQGVLNDMLSPLGYSDAFIGVLGFANGLVQNAGSLVSGFVVDKRLLRLRLKAVLLLGLAVMLVSTLLWALTCGVSGAEGWLLLLISLQGLGNGMADPLYYELGAEITYPAPEGTSAGVLVLLWNFTSLVLIFLPRSLGLAMNWLFLALILLSSCLAALVVEDYRRPADLDVHLLSPHETGLSLQPTGHG